MAPRSVGTTGLSSSDRTATTWECPHLHRIKRSERNPGRGSDTKTFAQFLQKVTIIKA